MKKIFLSAAIIVLTGLAQATTINAPANLIGNNVLNGNNAYAWGISIAVPTGQQVASAQIDFSNVKLTAANSSGVGYLYTDLLNYRSGGSSAVVLTDNDAAGDYFPTVAPAANITAIGTKFFAAVNTTLSWSYVLTGNQLIALNSYLTAGSFNIGFDPDCHYSVGGISFTYTLGTTPGNNTRVPDAATTAFLFFTSLACLALFRRNVAMVTK